MSEDLRTVVAAILNYPGECARLRDAVGSILYGRLIAAMEPTQPTPSPTDALRAVLADGRCMAADYERFGGHGPECDLADKPKQAATESMGPSVSTARPLAAADLLPTESPAEVNHEQARRMLPAVIMPSDWRAAFLRYISQQEARQQQADEYRHTLCNMLELDAGSEWQRVVDDVRETVGHVAMGDEHIENLEALVTELEEQKETLKARVAELDRDNEELRASAHCSRCGATQTMLCCGPCTGQMIDEQVATLQGKAEAIAELQSKLAGAVHAVADAKEVLVHVEAQRDELSRKLEATERELFSAHCILATLRGQPAPSRERPETWRASAHPTPPDQAPPAKPLTPNDVKAIARAVLAEVAERADELYAPSKTQLQQLAEAAKEGSK